MLLPKNKAEILELNAWRDSIKGSFWSIGYMLNFNIVYIFLRFALLVSCIIYAFQIVSYAKPFSFFVLQYYYNKKL